jgi:hypothetical protein
MSYFCNVFAIFVIGVSGETHCTPFAHVALNAYQGAILLIAMILWQAGHCVASGLNAEEHRVSNPRYTEIFVVGGAKITVQLILWHCPNRRARQSAQYTIRIRHPAVQHVSVRTKYRMAARRRRVHVSEVSSARG